MVRFLSVAVKKAFRAPKRTKTRVECNNIVTTKLAASRVHYLTNPTIADFLQVATE
jgi:hypothetical protein